MAASFRHPLVSMLSAALLMLAPMRARSADTAVSPNHGTSSRRTERHSSHVHSAPGGQVDVNRPASIFDCDTPRGEAWYGSTDHCLRELCAGGNFTNRYVDGFDNRPRKNPCYGRDPYELQR